MQLIEVFFKILTHTGAPFLLPTIGLIALVFVVARGWSQRSRLQTKSAVEASSRESEATSSVLTAVAIFAPLWASPIIGFALGIVAQSMIFRIDAAIIVLLIGVPALGSLSIVTAARGATWAFIAAIVYFPFAGATTLALGYIGLLLAPGAHGLY
jgi:hypothetical protein